MLGLALLLPVLAGAGLVAFTITRGSRLRVLDLTGEAPKSKRHLRAGTIDAVVLHQTGFTRGLDPQRGRICGRAWAVGGGAARVLGWRARVLHPPGACDPGRVALELELEDMTAASRG